MRVYNTNNTMRLLPLVLFCLFLFLPGCGNKGPLRLPAEMADNGALSSMTVQKQNVEDVF